MRTTSRFLGILLSVVLLFLSGCGSDGNKTVVDRKPGKTKSKSLPNGKTKKITKLIEDDLPALMPKIVLLESQKKTCKVLQGEKMPDFTLRDLEGEEHALSSILKQKLTVVFFWNAGEKEPRSSEEEQSSNALPYLAHNSQSQSGDVHYVFLNVGQKPDAIRKALEESDVKIPVLMDAEKTLFNKIATGLLPRIYLLDKQGRILWFDVGFQFPKTDNELKSAIRFVLKQDAKKPK